jgi:hypothetical protein
VNNVAEQVTASAETTASAADLDTSATALGSSKSKKARLAASTSTWSSLPSATATASGNHSNSHTIQPASTLSHFTTSTRSSSASLSKNAESKQSFVLFIYLFFNKHLISENWAEIFDFTKNNYTGFLCMVLLKKLDRKRTILE